MCIQSKRRTLQNLEEEDGGDDGGDGFDGGTKAAMLLHIGLYPIQVPLVVSSCIHKLNPCSKDQYPAMTSIWTVLVMCMLIS